MAQSEQVDMLVLGSGEAGKYLAWHMAHAGQRTAVVERQWVGGSCPDSDIHVMLALRRSSRQVVVADN